MFDDREAERDGPRRDRELTLGSFTLLAIFFGLVLLCGLFFGLGYAVGHHGAQDTAAATPPAASLPAAQADPSKSKPSASPQSGVAHAAESPPSDEPSSQSSGATPGSSSSSNTGSAPGAVVNTADPTGGATTSTRPAIQPALPPSNASPQPAAPGRVLPALAPATSAMLLVQIAAVTNQEDADVLMGALRRRGYAVSAHRDAADGLVHVRLGPFTSRDVANQWREKLLNDGYNAIVQP